MDSDDIERIRRALADAVCEEDGLDGFAAQQAIYALDRVQSQLAAARAQVEARDADITALRATLDRVAADLAAVRKLRDDFKEKSDVEYSLYIDRLKRPKCLGAEAKMADGTFTMDNLLAHIDAQRALGAHRAFMDASNALGRALAAQEGGNG